MKRITIIALLCFSVNASATLPMIPGSHTVIPYCLAATPTVPEGYFYQISTTALSGVPVTDIDARDENGNTYRTTLSYSGANVTAISCPIKQ